MSHTHELIDFTVAAFIVNGKRVLLVHHKQLDKWLPAGGHVEPDEDTDEALAREIAEETGLPRNDLIFIDNRPKGSYGNKFLMTPQYMDIHRINENHRHVSLIYFVASKTDNVRLKDDEHNKIKWFDFDELDDVELVDNVRFLAKEAIKTLSLN